MNLSFAKDHRRFSTAVEALRQAGEPITEETIKAKYEELGEIVDKSTKTVETTVDTPVEKPKKVAKKKKNA